LLILAILFCSLALSYLMMARHANANLPNGAISALICKSLATVIMAYSP
jgi:hypothetical protein